MSDNEEKSNTSFVVRLTGGTRKKYPRMITFEQ